MTQLARSGRVRPRTALRRRDEAGFTLIELIVVIAIMGVLAAIGVVTWQRWTVATAHEAAAQKVETILRQAQQRAVTEGSSLCVWFPAGDTWSLYRGACSATGKVLIAGPYETGDRRVHLDQVRFTSDAGIVRGVTFSPRGTASPGSITIVRDGSDVAKTVSVEGLTGRVATN